MHINHNFKHNRWCIVNNWVTIIVFMNKIKIPCNTICNLLPPMRTVLNNLLGLKKKIWGFSCLFTVTVPVNIVVKDIKWEICCKNVFWLISLKMAEKQQVVTSSNFSQTFQKILSCDHKKMTYHIFSMQHLKNDV